MLSGGLHAISQLSCLTVLHGSITVMREHKHMHTRSALKHTSHCCSQIKYSYVRHTF
jgi:hypothetical protein